MEAFLFAGLSSFALLYQLGLSLVEFGVEGVEIFAVQIVLSDAQGLAEAYRMEHFL